MSAAKRPRSSSCNRTDAKVRLAAARKYLEAAELLEAEAKEGIEESASVAATLAILSGIASTDAACCTKLKLRPRDDHNKATEFLKQIIGGDKAAKDLAQLISLKDSSSYGLIHVNLNELQITMRRAKALLFFADKVFNEG